MGNKYNARLGIGLTCLALLWGASLSPAYAGKGGTTVSGQTGQTGQVGGQTGQTGQVGGVTGTAPVLTTSLLVNGVGAACGSTVTSGASVCLQFSSSQSGTASITIQTGTGAATALTTGSVTAGTSYSVCVTAGTADGLTRTFTVMVTNSSGLSASQQCSFVVAGKTTQPVAGTTGQIGQTGQTGQTGQVGGVTGTAPVLTTSLLVNGVGAACGSTVAAGASVCLQFSSDQSGTAVITIHKGTGADTVLSTGSVTAGTSYSVCVTAGTADGLTRTFTVMVTNAAGLSSSQQCSFLVAGKSVQPVGGQTGQIGQTGQVGGQTGKTGQPVGGATGTAPLLTTSLLVNGVAAACGSTVPAGAQVCLLFTSDQSGTASILTQTGTGSASVLASGSVLAGTSYSVCVSAVSADVLTRTFTVMVTNSSGLSSSQQCSFAVVGQAVQPVGGATGQAPNLTSSLLVNGVAAACGSMVPLGAQVCLRFTSDQNGTAVVMSQSATGATTVLANGGVLAGTSYNICVSAGTHAGLTQTFTVMVTNNSGLSTTQHCSFVVH